MKKLIILSIFLAIGLSGKSQPLQVDQPDSATLVETAESSLTLEKIKLMKVAINLNCNFINRKNIFLSKTILQEYVQDNDFWKGKEAMGSTLTGKKNYSAAGLIETLGEKKEYFLSESAQLGGLSELSQKLYEHYDFSHRNFTSLDELIGVISTTEKLGDCRSYAFLTAKVSQEAFGLRSSVLTGYNHEIALIKSKNHVFLIDNMKVISGFNGQSLDSKDQVDAAIMARTGQITTNDITIDPEKNQVSYINRYNNFSGLWNKLQNRGSGDRTISFFNQESQSLFSHINAKGVLSATMERDNWGLESYYVLPGNQFGGFLRRAWGLNLAGSLPFSSRNGKWRETLFTKLGLYRTILSVQPREENSKPMQKTYGLQGGLESYTEYLFTPRLSSGVISILNLNREVAREGGSLLGKLAGGGSISPFISYEFDNLKLVAGTEVVETFALPSLWRPTAIPWAQALWQSGNFSSSIRGEYQPASFRVDYLVTWSKDFGQIQFRTFAEKYSAKFKETNLYHDSFGTEIGLAWKIKGISGINISVTGLTDNCGSKNLFLNLGVKF